MQKRFITYLAAMALALVMLPAEKAAAQEQFAANGGNEEVYFENLCAPAESVDVQPAEVDQELVAIPMDYHGIEQVRIDLLELGFNPGFDPERRGEIDPELKEAVRQFQVEYGLAPTGQLDVATLGKLGIFKPGSKNKDTAETQRAKPSESRR